jgi:hypothetical protein
MKAATRRSAIDPPGPRQVRDATLVITGNWPAIMAQHSPADLRPIRVRGEAKARRLAG